MKFNNLYKKFRLNLWLQLYFSDKILQLNEPGDPLWMTREEYIIFGAQRLASCDSTIREGWYDIFRILTI